MWGGEAEIMLVHELGSAFVIICGELQSKHLKGGDGEL